MADSPTIKEVVALRDELGDQIMRTPLLRCRALEPFAGDSRIFIYPGYRFRVIDGLITNFHLPESTLLMLVSALAGRDRILAAYRHAVEQRYRFFSYGDAMLIA